MIETRKQLFYTVVEDLLHNAGSIGHKYYYCNLDNSFDGKRVDLVKTQIQQDSLLKPMIFDHELRKIVTECYDTITEYYAMFVCDTKAGLSDEWWSGFNDIKAFYETLTEIVENIHVFEETKANKLIECIY